MKRLIGIAVLSATSVAAFAQNYSSFLFVGNITGITVTPSNGLNHYNIAVGANPTFEYNSVVYDITSVWGFWLMKDVSPPPLSPVNNNIGPWTVNNSVSGPSEIAGWKSSPTNGITPGNNQQLNFVSVNGNLVDRYGFHVTLGNGQLFPGTQGNTGYITGTLVPEPGSMAALGLGLATLLRKKRSRK